MASSIEFSLFAPRVPKAALIGSFSNWEEIPMQKGQDGYFRTQVELEDGAHQYKFRVQSKSEAFLDQWIDANDPYATEIDRVSQNSVVRIKEGQRFSEPYVWQHDDKPLPANHELIIYEMHVADFSGEDANVPPGKHFQQAITKLDYLKSLGINAIELLPITEYKGSYRWGYLVNNFFAPESSYGTPGDLKQLVDECHARGIRVFMDGIYNHSDEQSPLLKIDRDYWYYHHMHYPDDPDNFWGPEFNYENYDEVLDIKPAWKFIGDVVRHWVQEYHIDGIRYDAIRQLGNYEFLFWITQEALKAAGNKPFYNIAEHIPEAVCITQPDGPFEGCWHESFRIFAIGHISGENINFDKLKESLDSKIQGFRGATAVVNYLASHDRDRTLRELGDRSIFDQPAFGRAKLGAVLVMTAVGIPMIWMGDEFGEYRQKSEVTTKPSPIRWHLLEQDLNHDLFEFYQKIIQCRHSNSALQTENIEFFHQDLDNTVLAYVRWNDVGNRVVVIANFSNQSFDEYEVPYFPENGMWRDWFTNELLEAQDHRLTTSLEAVSAKVFIYQPQ